jgi:hypothetical protein
MTLLALAACSSSSTGPDCPCPLCSGFAISLVAIDANSEPVIDGWDAEAVVDGDAIDTQCSPLERETNATPNGCSFGGVAGVYQIVVHHLGPDIELVARNAEPSGVDCCNTTLCSLPRTVVFELP